MVRPSSIAEPVVKSATDSLHIWRPHDFVIWDNRCTMHRARPFDDKTHRRELRHTTTLDLPLPAQA
jgi:alpha-ketoglutarate-dependent 2,4-dichlorophenoxyacetate dioxygenase